MLSAADRALGEPIDVVIAGDPADQRFVALQRSAAGPYAPDLVIAPLPDGDAVAELPIFAAKVPRDGAPTAYVCRGYACDAPTSDPDLVSSQVKAQAGSLPGG